MADLHPYHLLIPGDVWRRAEMASIRHAGVKRASMRQFILDAMEVKCAEYGFSKEPVPVAEGQVVEVPPPPSVEAAPAKPVFRSKFDPSGAGLGPHNLIEEREKFVALHGDPGDGWRLPDRQRFMMKNYPHYVERLAKLEGPTKVVGDAPSPVAEPAPVAGEWM